MSKPSFESQTALHQYIKESSLDEFIHITPSLSSPEVVETLTLLQSQPAVDGKNKLLNLWSFVVSESNLETLSKHFSAFTFVNFLDFLIHEPKFQNKLSQVLIGLHPLIFSQALHLVHENHLDLLKQEGKLEPLQYQLTQFFHEGETLKQKIEESVQLFKQECTTIAPDQLSPTSLQNLIDNVDDWRDQFIDYLERASTAIALVWHTDRIDLIEKLSSMNESIQHQLINMIGHSAFNQLPSTGLYAYLEQTLSNIFDSSLKDDDASIEGMTRLAVWHLKDYSELGLLPSMQKNHLDLEKSPEKERWEKQTLNSLVQNQLERLGIGRVGDLKKHHLYSKHLLKEYIKKHYELLLKTPSI